MTEHVHTVDCFVEGVQVCGMQYVTKQLAERDETLALAAKIARDYTKGRIPEGKAAPLIQGRWEGENAASGNIAMRIEAEMSTAPGRQSFERYQIAHSHRGNFLNVDQVPLLTDKQDREARAGVCPRCLNHTLSDTAQGQGLRFMGCGACLSIVVLASRPDDRQLVTIQGRRVGRTYLAQQIKLAMSSYEQRGGRAAGYCTEGGRCVCGGDLPAIQARCGNWRER
jgi:hypothetical protein